MNQPELRISLLGGVTITQNGTVVSGFASRKVEALLVYLVCNPRPHARDVLATLLWPNNDQTRALANLSVALTSLRKQLDAYLLTERHTVAFNTETAFQLDTAVFQQTIAQAKETQQQNRPLNRTSAAQLATAVTLYQGDFLTGFSVRGAPEFEAWALLEQEHLRQLFLTALTDLTTFHQQRGQIEESIRYARQLLTVDPLQENIHRQLMALFMQDNQRAAALAQYEQCVRILEDELGVEPDEETSTLYEQMAANEWHIEEASLPIPHVQAKHNLASATTRFVGREAELAQIDEWLDEPNGRLLTIIGPGGMGKSRLAQEAARAHLGEFADGVYYVSLVPYTDTAQVITAVSESIGLTLTGNEEPAAQLSNHLQTREMLLVLDNLEHLLSPTLLALITQLIEKAPDLRLIGTSRQRLRLQAEALLELRGLPYPTISQHTLDHFPAVQLFVNRVQQIKRDFRLDEQVTAVIQLCQLVDGLPLALELAATWTRVLSVAEIVAEIQTGLDALTSTLHDIPERHRSLHAVIESSWQMLPMVEQTLFRKSAVFRGGFTREATQQVAKATTLPQLMSLVDHSFLRLDGDQRFRRHPLLLQFAQAQFATHSDEQIAMESAHATFFAEFVQSRETALHGATAPQTLAAISADLENIRKAWQWALSPLHVDLLDKMVTGIGRFFNDKSRNLEGSALFESSLKTLNTQPETAVSEPIIAKIQVELGRFWHDTGRFAEAETILKEAYRLNQRHHLIPNQIACLRQLGIVIADQGRWQEAHTYLAEALPLCKQAGDEDQILLVLNALGNLLISTGDYVEARAYFDEAMALAQAAGNTLRIAILHSNIAIIDNREGNPREAIRQWQLAQQGFMQLNHEVGLANTNHNIAMAYTKLEAYDEALASIQAANALHKKVGHKRGMAGGLAVMGSIYVKMGKRREARRHYYDSLQMAQEVGVTWVALGAVAEIGELEISYGNMAQALRLLTFAVHHPAIEADSLQKAQKLLDELAAELPKEMIIAAETAVQSLTLDALIAQLLAN
jgi:DNA-binding SARP family transcriptional activator/predicted ATPase/Tfp pilus assembly protein PilF